MEKTLVIIKPCTIQRGLIGEIIQRFEKKGLQLCGIKMIQMTEELLEVHYAHLAHRSFFGRIKESMMRTPVIMTCWEGLDAVKVARALTGVTNGRDALPGTIRGDFSMSTQENIVHASDSPTSAQLELERFFLPDEIFKYDHNLDIFYANDEI